MAKAIVEYCPMCDSYYLSDLPHDCTMIISKPAVPAMSDDASRIVWNAAIEAAAKVCDEAGYEPIAEVIRDLKK